MLATKFGSEFTFREYSIHVVKFSRILQPRGLSLSMNILWLSIS